MKRIVLAGGSGFLGQALASHFHKSGWEVVVLTRSAGGSGRPGVRFVQWDSHSAGPWQREIDGAKVVMNLSGKSVDCRYNTQNRREILDSRVLSTKVIGEAIRQAANPPQVWFNASTATLYKHTFDRAWDESGAIEAVAEAKDKFSVEVGRAWERALNESALDATRKIAMRMAMVLGFGKNSVFPVLQRLVRFGLGGKMGRGDQFVSWIHVEDLCRAVDWIIEHNDIAGPINCCAPNPETNRDMMRILRSIMGMPIGLPATEWMLEVGAFFLRTETELIIKSRRVIPGCLLASGFQFRFPTMREAFEDLARGPEHVGRNLSH